MEVMKLTPLSNWFKAKMKCFLSGCSDSVDNLTVNFVSHSEQNK